MRRQSLFCVCAAQLRLDLLDANPLFGVFADVLAGLSRTIHCPGGARLVRSASGKVSIRSTDEAPIVELTVKERTLLKAFCEVLRCRAAG